MVLNTAQEPAIKDLVREARRSRGHGVETVMLHSAVGKSQDNAEAERSIRRVCGLRKTIKCDLEHKTGQRLGRTHTTFPWLMEWCCLVLNSYVKDSEGMTPYRWVKGKDATRPI